MFAGCSKLQIIVWSFHGLIGPWFDAVENCFPITLLCSIPLCTFPIHFPVLVRLHLFLHSLSPPFIFFPLLFHFRTQNGFIIGEGEFRDSKDPANERCLRELMEGNVPRELEPAVREQFPGAHQVGINLVNRTQEEYVPPPPKFSFAESQGHSLGGQGVEEVISFAEAVPLQYERKEEEKKAGMVQLVTADRKRIRLEVSDSTRVIDIFQHMMSLSGLGASDFVLVAGFPPKPLQDALATLVEEKLVGSSIEQRLVKKE